MEWGAIWEFLRQSVFDRYDAILRLMLAAALGGMIGLEREASGKPAGFRTNLLICLGAALVMEVSILVGLRSNSDPGRIGAQIVSGIGFLGAGTILHFRGNVIGLTTAATLWVVAAIGMAVGAEAYLEAIGATSLVMLALMLLGRVEDHLIPRKPSDRIVDLVLLPDAGNVAGVEEVFAKSGFKIETLKIEKRSDALYVSLQARGDGRHWDQLTRDLVEHETVRKAEFV
jgi:putative Mg2+ transporter-C (MgtC) family protein